MMMQQFTDADNGNDDDDDGDYDDEEKVSVMEDERSTMLPQITKTMWNNNQQRCNTRRCKMMGDKEA